MGHAGTLDPAASGLLVVLLARATRLARFVAMLPKRYVGIIRFGWETSTDDAAGEIAGERDESWRALGREDVESALLRVQAQPVQQPPAVSAKKVGGVRAYRRARRGEPTDLKAVPVVIWDLRLEAFDREAGQVGVMVECSSGTYIRAIARDVGRALGTRAHLAALRRTAIGEWNVKDALPLAALGGPLPIRPMAEAVAHLPAVILPHAEAQRLAHGQKLSATDQRSGPVAVYESGGLLAVAEARAGVLHPDVVLGG